MALIYHVTDLDSWKIAQQQGSYSAPSLETEGFIHNSEAHQVDGVLRRYYTGQTGLLKLVIDTEKLTAPLKYELAPSVNEYFPHIFGPINLDAIVAVEPIPSI